MLAIRQKIYVHVFVFFVLVLGFSESVRAKSVYAIADHSGGKIKAYRIQGDQIRYQTTVNNLPHIGINYGPIGITCDPNSLYLFITSEDSDKIILVNAKTMVAEPDPTVAPGAYNLAGIIYDAEKQAFCE